MLDRSNAENHHKLEDLVGKIVSDFQNTPENDRSYQTKAALPTLQFAPTWNSKLENGLL